MRPITISRTGVGSTAAVPMDYYISPFNVGFGVVVTGSATYTVQHTFDNVFDSTVTPTWFNHPVIAAQTTNQDGNYAFPVTAIRLTVTAGAGTATMTLVQAGLTGN